MPSSRTLRNPSIPYRRDLALPRSTVAAAAAAWHLVLMTQRWWIVACAAATMWATACPRPCESSANCVRTCSCLNERTDIRQDCSIAFRCEGDTRRCEAAVDEQSCNDICGAYADGRCGVERCLTDADCVKVIACPTLDLNGAPTGLTTDCTLSFRCQPEYEACQPRSTASIAALCANECVTRVIADEP